MPFISRVPPVFGEKQNTSFNDPRDVPTQPTSFRDQEETGDNEARPDEMGSGPAQPTGDPTSFGGITSIRHPSSDYYDLEQEVLDSDDFEIVEANDGRLGLTNIGNKPAEDWAADTGETTTPESEP